MPLIPERNIVFFGETGTGKSSAINLLETGTSAQVSNDSRPRTQVSAAYKTTLYGVTYTLWDTRGLGEASGFLQNIFRFWARPETDLKKFLKERYKRREIDLLVYCVRGSRATQASAKYYNKFCVTTRQLAVPVVILVTELENEPGSMDDWWQRNSVRLAGLGMEFDDHACITALPGDARTAESKRRLVDLITKGHCGQAHYSESYFGSPVQTPIPSTSPAEEVSSQSSSYNAPSAGNSVPLGPFVETIPAPINVPTGVDHLRVNIRSLHSSKGSFGAGNSLYSLARSLHSSNTSLIEVPRHQENEDYLSELPLRRSDAIVVRKMHYSTRSGAFGDIWECELISRQPSCDQVAVKAMKLSANVDKKRHIKKLRRELKIWGSLHHQNIVPLLGIVHDFGPLPSMVSPWFQNGSLTFYLEKHQKSASEKDRLLGDIATGLSYVHSRGVIHGDLHSENVLIDDNGRACLTDFGLSLTADFVGTSYLKSSICGALQFADPALVQQVARKPSDIYPTKHCDVYSFGSLMLHILSGKKPYDGLTALDIWGKVSTGERPNIPTCDGHEIPHQALMQRCWNQDERERPSADDLVATFAQK